MCDCQPGIFCGAYLFANQKGSFGYVDTAMSTPELNGFMRS